MKHFKLKFKIKIKPKIICCILAGLLIVAGFVLVANGLEQTEYSLANFFVSQPKTKTETVDLPFDSVEIIESNCRVEVRFDDGANAAVKYPEKGASKQSVSVKNGKLTVKANDGRTFFERLKFSLEKPTVTVYIPINNHVDSLSVNTTSGTIHVYYSNTCVIGDIKLTSKTGNIYSDSLASGNISLKSEKGLLSVSNAKPQNVKAVTKSGDVTLSTLEIANSCKAKTDSGKLKINKVRAQTIESENIKGKNELYDAWADTLLSVKSEKGNIQLKACDGKLIKVQNGSGSIKGTIRSERSYNVMTSFGKVEIPKDSIGEPCELSTVSGDIEITRFSFSEWEDENEDNDFSIWD